jgi:hypothetical protein
MKNKKCKSVTKKAVETMATSTDMLLSIWGNCLVGGFVFKKSLEIARWTQLSKGTWAGNIQFIWHCPMYWISDPLDIRELISNRGGCVAY